MTKIPMKLIKDHMMLRSLGYKVLRVDIGILPGPTYFDQVLFCTKTHSNRDSIARTRVEYNARVRPGNMQLNWESHAGAVSLSDHPKPATDYHLKTGQRE